MNLYVPKSLQSSTNTQTPPKTLLGRDEWKPKTKQKKKHAERATRKMQEGDGDQKNVKERREVTKIGVKRVWKRKIVKKKEIGFQRM